MPGENRGGARGGSLREKIDEGSEDKCEIGVKFMVEILRVLRRRGLGEDWTGRLAYI